VRRTPRRPLARALALAAIACSVPALAAETATPAAPGEGAQGGPCPAIDEGFVLCSSDPWSGNCAQFVEAAGRLAQLYQIQADDTPDRVPVLLSTNWWGCGDAPLEAMQGLLLRIGTPEALAVLRQQPFSLLPPPGGERAPAPRAPTLVQDCEDAPAPDARDACAARELTDAREAYRSALAACRARVAAPLRNELDGSEQAFEQELPAQCEAPALEYDDPRLRAFARSQCLAQALRERRRGMLAAHPECQTRR